MVDKGDYSFDGQVLVESIDETKVNLVFDPAVYIVNSGTHTVSFSFDDFRKEKKSEQVITGTMQPGRYYQVIPVRNKEDIRFELSEIARDKPDTIGKREFKSVTNYLIRGESGRR